MIEKQSLLKSKGSTIKISLTKTSGVTKSASNQPAERIKHRRESLMKMQKEMEKEGSKHKDQLKVPYLVPKLEVSKQDQRLSTQNYTSAPSL